MRRLKHEGNQGHEGQPGVRLRFGGSIEQNVKATLPMGEVAFLFHGAVDPSPLIRRSNAHPIGKPRAGEDCSNTSVCATRSCTAARLRTIRTSEMAASNRPVATTSHVSDSYRALALSAVGTKGRTVAATVPTTHRFLMTQRINPRDSVSRSDVRDATMILKNIFPTVCRKGTSVEKYEIGRAHV